MVVAIITDAHIRAIRLQLKDIKMRVVGKHWLVKDSHIHLIANCRGVALNYVIPTWVYLIANKIKSYNAGYTCVRGICGISNCINPPLHSCVSSCSCSPLKAILLSLTYPQ